MNKKMKSAIVIATAFASGIWMADAAFTREPVSAAPKAALIANVELPSDVKNALTAVTSAYAIPLELKGKLTVDFDAGGRKMNETREFAATLNGPGVFRSEFSDNSGLIVGDGKSVTIFLPKANGFVPNNLDVSAPMAARLPSELREILVQQNPALVAGFDATLLIAPNATDVRSTTSTSGRLIHWSSDGVSYDLTIDEASSFIQRLDLDVTKGLTNSGTPDVNKALIAIEFQSTRPSQVIDPTIFAFTPPASARDLSKPATEMMAATDASDLKGKPAPDFTLSDLEGKSVKLSDLIGSVVVLDFWATWCGPCRVGLPHIDSLYQKHKADGLKVFAVNLEEDKATAKAFVDKTKLGLPVLLDTDGDVGRSYAANAIPMTVVIGEDGVVQEVVVGLSPKAIDAAVEKAMKPK